MREMLSKFMNISTRTYSNWKKNKHCHIIEIINLIFKNQEDIELWLNHRLLSQYTYFENLEERHNKDYREILCKLLGIKNSSYYSWKKGRYSNIILLFNQIFKNSENVKYWIENNKFQFYYNDADINNSINLLNRLNQICYCIDNFNAPNSTFSFTNIDFGLLENEALIIIESENISTNKSIKVQLINNITLSNINQIKDYQRIIKVIEIESEHNLYKLLEIPTIYKMFFLSIKNTDINLFIKLTLLVFKSSYKDIDEFFSYLEQQLKIAKTHFNKILLHSNKNLSTKEIRRETLLFLFMRILSSLYTIGLNKFLISKDRDNMMWHELKRYQDTMYN